ncbi:MAG: TRAP transporter substrate-binding protein DctP, partial [Bacteroidota bacterium]
MTFLDILFQRNQKYFHLIRFVIFPFLIMVSLIIPVRGEPDQVNLHLAHGATNDHPTNRATLEVQKEIALRTDNRIRLEIFSNMQFGEEAELIELLQKGGLDIGIISTGPLSAYNPDLDILDLPYLFDHRQQAYQVWDGEAGAAI